MTATSWRRISYFLQEYIIAHCLFSKASGILFVQRVSETPSISVSKHFISFNRLITLKSVLSCKVLTFQVLTFIARRPSGRFLDFWWYTRTGGNWKHYLKIDISIRLTFSRLNLVFFLRHHFFNFISYIWSLLVTTSLDDTIHHHGTTSSFIHGSLSSVVLWLYSL